MEERISRVCWNKNGWVKPSGPLGKSRDKYSHENRFGYGHEEWLADTGKIIDGYHYGFLQPIRKNQEKYIGGKYNITLFSINSSLSERYLVGRIKNAIVIDSSEADLIRKTYQKNKWLLEMSDDIEQANANAKKFLTWKGIDLFNIKFKVNDLTIYPEYIELEKKHSLWHSTVRYMFLHGAKMPDVVNFKPEPFSFRSSPISKPDKNHRKMEFQMIEIPLLHSEICEGLYKLLSKEYGKNNVTHENSTGDKTKIDLVRKQNNEYILYEVKTYPNIRNSIRAALGQILEYAFWQPDKKIRELIIVSHLESTPEATKYLKHLRTKYKLPIYYQSFNKDLTLLSQKI